MRTRQRLLLLCLLVGIVGFGDRPKASGPTAKFHVIGDIDNPSVADGAMTVIRDATHVGSGIYAVGGAVTRQLCAALPFSAPCTNTDTPILWRFDGTNATLEALPDINPNTNASQTLGAVDITPDGQYIASAARVSNAPAPGFSSLAVRVTTSLLPGLAATLNLQTTFSPALNFPGRAFSISSDGTISYGDGSAAGSPSRAIRFDTTGVSSLMIPLVCPAVSLPQCPVADTSSVVAQRGTSADGSVAVGSSFPVISGPHKAYRYVHGAGVTAIPQLPGGTSNDSLAVSPDGDLVLVQGRDVNGELYLYRASTGQIQRLGSPNPDLLEAWGPGGRLCVNDEHVCANARGFAAGMSADGSVVVANFAGGLPAGGQNAYFHNPHGWFHLTSALFAHGVDLGPLGFTAQTLLITGMSPDGTLVFGTGAQNGVLKGFVAEFPVGALASFNPTPSPPADPSIVGAWSIPDDPNDVIVFTADGAYYQIGRMESGAFTATGFEHGHYTFNGSVFTLTTLVDTNGAGGISDANGSAFPGTVTGDTLTLDVDFTLHRIVGGPGSLVGGWVAGNPTEVHNSLVVVFTASDLFNVFDFPDGDDSGTGTYTWNPTTHELIFTPTGGMPDNPDHVTLSPDELSAHVIDDGGVDSFDVTRVVDPRTPKITSALDATATTGLAFAYQITATNAPTTFGAIGLPAGLHFDIATGVISGTPSALGTFDIRIEAANALSTSTGRNHLSLVVIAPAVVSPGPTTVTPIPPEAPGETPPVTIQFENVTNGGTISVATIDPEADTSPAPPSGFSLGDDPVYFEILPSPGLTFTGPVTVCFSYAGITFSGFPRLLHYDTELMTWVDITVSVDTDMQIICGLTSSFSPFVIGATARNALGFHAPINPVAGELNAVKGGSTVALKFNVFSAPGVEVTDPNDLHAEFKVSSVACEEGTPSNSELLPTTGNTGLRYDTSSHQFVQNWKTPKNPGCYLVQMKGEGLLLSALFRVK